ncbi:uncharacterized protein YALI1_C08275g [Yarrowia lipolytica]|uniref:Uncharacterized protein n=1 Tax=Yarrowia lipolytica TaxID=4952 RepID=A0A1D8N9W9_YARLL|nr:hypothetical protein YALI1_C08275g [Yarrowia lipolytica]
MFVTLHDTHRFARIATNEAGSDATLGLGTVKKPAKAGFKSGPSRTSAYKLQRAGVKKERCYKSLAWAGNMSWTYNLLRS